MKQRWWSGDLVSGIYDQIMIRSVFPRKFKADYRIHCQIIEDILKKVHSQSIIEIGTGSGFTAPYIPLDNEYTGVDISPNLLKKAAGRFKENGFTEGEDVFLERACAEQLPFENNSFSYGLCILTFNFIQDQKKAVEELSRVMKKGSTGLFAVPCPERMDRKVNIKGTLLSSDNLKRLFADEGFTYNLLPVTNGALLYFTVSSS